ncbi:hypothetical protein GCM10010977_08550 [Citricoccus zhacaiensis]|uniref:Antitoxin n=1 Tax=Citricoccus zhacaiensis TaxID=489142 RepID=A0ABQ2LS65_9MICC|nr:hypothetical protein [Citricoccus zhacaiensis]GGO42526.1 hypothetical protein GCM10010977_08550 [Citricoccus zhacaiensis]
MSGIGDAADKAMQSAQDNPEDVNQPKDLNKDFADKRDKGEQEQGDEKHPQ